MIVTSRRHIAKNTIMLYFRQILSTLISLYTIRVVFNVLGPQDYGVYNVIAGVVTSFSFLSGAMAIACQRFFSFAIGHEDKEALDRSFSTMMIIFTLASIVIVILAETLGLWFVLNILDIPVDRIVAAKWIYQASIISFVMTIMTIPYMASIMAHENMSVYAYISILEVSLKLAVVFLLQQIPYDKLALYGILLAMSTGIVTAVYRKYCKVKYEECHIKFVWDKPLFLKIVSYSGWNLFGNIAWIGKNQGIIFLLNIFCGTLVNAAQGIALQVRAVCAAFAQNFSSALQPPIIKHYASRNLNEMLQLTFQGSKITFFLMLLLILPLYFSLKFIFFLWLGDVPEYTLIFTRLLLIETLIDSISMPMASANQATGNVKYYQLLIGIAGLLNLPCAYIALLYGASPSIVFTIGIFLQIIIVFIRIAFLSRIWERAIKMCFVNVLLPCIAVAVTASAICYILPFTATSFLSLSGTIVAQIIIIGIAILGLGLTLDEKKMVVSMLKKQIN